MVDADDADCQRLQSTLGQEEANWSPWRRQPTLEVKPADDDPHLTRSTASSTVAASSTVTVT